MLVLLAYSVPVHVTAVIDEHMICMQNVDVLKDPDTVKQLSNILKTNVRACKSLGHPYMLQVCAAFYVCARHVYPYL